MNHFFRLKEYFFYLSSARGIQSIHSPFLFDFFQNVLKDERAFYCFEEIESLRDEMFLSNLTINVNDLGAGSSAAAAYNRKLKDIVHHSASPPSVSQLLFRIANYFECRKILELGTCAGITTLYFASVHAANQVVTIEGDNGLAAVSRENFKLLRRKNIILLEGSFEQKLPEGLQQLQSLDLAYIDGNHRRNATISYFESMIPYTHDGSIIIVGDIHWSEEMKRAWNDLILDPRVTLSIDLFYVGIIFFRTALSKENFTLRY